LPHNGDGPELDKHSGNPGGRVTALDSPAASRFSAVMLDHGRSGGGLPRPSAAL